MAEHNSVSKKLHIAMLPWLAFGHMIPFLELSKQIAQKGHKISFISTPRNIDRLPKLPPNLSSFIDFVRLPLPEVEHLPPNAEATSDLPYDKVQYLKKAYDQLQDNLTWFLESSDPDWILYDFATVWVHSIGAKLGIKTAFFSIFTAPFLGFYGPASKVTERTKPEDFTVPPAWVPFPTTVAFRYFEIMRIFDSTSVNESGVSDTNRFNLVLEKSEIIAVRGCPEFEPEWFEVLGEIYQRPIFPVGQLPTTEYDSGEETDTCRSVKDWLDNQEERSVVYVAFGSEAKPSQEELTEIAHGLERSELPFFWVLRTHRGESDPESLELPDGFEERTKGRGVVWTSWAPQLKILSHVSVGGFLTHSGWSSVVEAIKYGKTLILLTFLADQGINARVLEEKKMGYSIPRDERDGSFSNESVAESIRLVMLKEEGKVYRERIKEMRGLFVNKDKQDSLVDKLLEYLKTHRNGRKLYGDSA